MTHVECLITTMCRLWPSLAVGSAAEMLKKPAILAPEVVITTTGRSPAYSRSLTDFPISCQQVRYRRCVQFLKYMRPSHLFQIEHWNLCISRNPCCLRPSPR